MLTEIKPNPCFVIRVQGDHPFDDDIASYLRVEHWCSDRNGQGGFERWLAVPLAFASRFTAEAVSERLRRPPPFLSGLDGSANNQSYELDPDNVSDLNLVFEMCYMAEFDESQLRLFA